MKTLKLSLLTLMAALLLPLGAQAQEADDLEVTLEAVPADSSADAAINNIELPEDADPQAHKNAEFGIDTANKARRLREEMSHEFGSEVDATRERARERTQNIQVPGERP